MNEDLIKRSDAIEAYSDIYWIDDRLNLAFREELDKIDEKIRNIPIVEVVDRPQGKWKSVKASIYPYGYDVECSICGHRMGSSFGYKFCPMCGAKMKGVDDE